MSLYNILNGYNPACVLILPMLGRHYNEYPRFRDCFISEDGNILVYTRVGGNNRNQGYGEEELYKDPNFVRTYDDDYDSTYGYYEFNVPDKWRNDFNNILSGDFDKVSDEYIECVKNHYPSIDCDRIFRNGGSKDE